MRHYYAHYYCCQEQAEWIKGDIDVSSQVQALATENRVWQTSLFALAFLTVII